MTEKMYILCSGKASIMGIYIDRNRILRVVEHLREEKTSQLTGKKITLTDQIYQDIFKNIPAGGKAEYQGACPQV